MIQTSLVQALGIIDCAILKRQHDNEYELLHCNKDWFYAFAPEATGKKSFSFSGEQAFLSDFLIDAETFWQKGNQGQIHSGIWSEQTASSLLRLEAIAANNGNEHFLIISNLQHEYERQQKTLQVARELLISNDKMLAQHEYVHERLDELLKQSKDLQTAQLPIRQAIDNAEFGVAVLDAKLQPVTVNPSLFALFDLEPTQSPQQPVDILMDLLQQQFPEFDRLFATGSRWHGELYWLKPPNLSKWLQLAINPVQNDYGSIQHWVMLVSDISRMKYLLQNNEKLTQYDVLTDLPNRQSFWQHLTKSVAQQTSTYVLHLNVKDFKRVNELFGHLAGDQLLQQLVKRIAPLLAENDLFARIGGDEFAIALHNNISRQFIQELSARLIEVVRTPFVFNEQQRYQVGVNIGAAHFPQDASDAEDLMKFADLAAFEARKVGKSNLKFYSADLKEASRRRLELEAALREAIENGQFELHLQPIFDLTSKRIVKAEALLRWHRPNVGLVTPDEFIPVAEQTGLIVPIGKWVISQAMLLLTELANYQADIKLSVNLSPKQVGDRNLLDYIRGQLASSKVSAQSLELELTEGVLLEDYEKAQYLLEEVRNLGMTVSIDDFGTGYSSLSYLQRLPIDYLKIDRSFVHDLDSNENDKAIVLAVIALAHSLKLGVIAEGVENEQQREFLEHSNCNNAQGYLFSKPLPFTDFCQLLEQPDKRLP